MRQHMEMMERALAEARAAFALGEVPVGAVIAREGAVIASAHNRTRTDRDPSAHAELLAIRRAAAALGDFRLTGCTLYVTLEPCAMCAGAILTARLQAVWYGAADPRAGCCGSRYHLLEDASLGTATPTYPGLLAAESVELLRRFFAERRDAP